MAEKKKKLKKLAKKAQKQAKLDQKQPKNVSGERYVSRLQFSKLMNIPYSTLQYAIDKGRIHLTQVNGRFLVDSVIEKEAYLNSIKVITKHTLKIKDADDNKIAFDIGEANLRVAVYKSKKLEMEYWREIGNLIPVIRVNSKWATIAQELKKSLMAIAPRIGAIMVGCTDPHEATQILKRELNKSLTNISEKGLIDGGIPDFESNDA